MKFAISETPGRVFVEPDLLPICGTLQSLVWGFDGITLIIRQVPKQVERPRRTEWPSNESLIEEIKNSTWVAVAKRLGVDQATLRRRLAQKRTT